MVYVVEREVGHRGRGQPLEGKDVCVVHEEEGPMIPDIPFLPHFFLILRPVSFTKGRVRLTRGGK